MKQFSFPKSKRLVKNKQFKNVLANRTCASDELLMVYAVKNDCGLVRLGISVSKSFGNAVTRNHLKRLIREAFRLNQHQLSSGVDYMVMISPQLLKVKQDCKKAAKELKLDHVSNSLLSLAVKAVRKIT